MPVSFFTIFAASDLLNRNTNGSKSTLIIIFGAAFLVCAVILVFAAQNVTRGTPHLYDYATEQIVQHAMINNPPGYPLGMYFISESYKIDGKPLIYEPKEVYYHLPFPTFSNVVCTPSGNLAFINPIPKKKNPVICFSGLNARFSPELKEFRKDSQLTVLADGRLLITGGFKIDGQPSDTIEIFDTHKMKFEEPFGKLNIARANHRATCLRNGKVLVVSGTTTKELSDAGDDYTSTIELIDPARKTITLIGQLYQARTHAMIDAVGIDKCIIRHGKFVDKNTAARERENPNNIEAWEIYTGKVSESPKYPYPFTSWLWYLSHVLNKK